MPSTKSAARLLLHAGIQYHYVCILASLTCAEKHYIGMTTDLKKCLAKHNEGGCPHTVNNRPWRIETAIAFRNKRKASAF